MIAAIVSATNIIIPEQIMNKLASDGAKYKKPDKQSIIPKIPAKNINKETYLNIVKCFNG